MTKIEEVWKDIPGYEGYYQVSNLGRVKSLSRKFSPKEIILKSVINRCGYEMVALQREHKSKSCTVHRLVAIAFLGQSHLEVDHVNGIKTDNRLVNLEFVTPSENSKRTFLLGLRRSYKGVNNSSCKLDDKKILEIREIITSHNRPSFAEIGRRYGVTDVLIGKIARRENWKHI